MNYTTDSALEFLYEKRNRVKPNKGFMAQLYNYEIINKENNKEIFNDIKVDQLMINKTWNWLINKNKNKNVIKYNYFEILKWILYN